MRASEFIATWLYIAIKFDYNNVLKSWSPESVNVRLIDLKGTNNYFLTFKLLFIAIDFEVKHRTFKNMMSFSDIQIYFWAHL